MRVGWDEWRARSVWPEVVVGEGRPRVGRLRGEGWWLAVEGKDSVYVVGSCTEVVTRVIVVVRSGTA